MPKTPVITTEEKRNKIKKLKGYISRVVQKTLSLREYKKIVDTNYDKAWKDRNSKKIQIYSVLLKRIVNKLSSRNAFITELENRCSKVQQELNHS